MLVLRLIVCGLTLLVIATIAICALWKFVEGLGDEDGSEFHFYGKEQYNRNDEEEENMEIKTGFAVGRIHGRKGRMSTQQGDFDINLEKAQEQEVIVLPVVKVQSVQVDVMPWIKRVMQEKQSKFDWRV